MPKEGKSVIARLTVKGEHFEALVEPELAWELKSGKEVDFKSLLVSDIVYKDSGKGLKASEEAIKKNFGTTDPKEVISQIIKKGDIQLTTDQRREMVENKRKQIVAFIARNCIDPKSGTPHPPLRIENAMANVRVNVDPFRPADEQAQEVIKALRTELPLKVSQAVLTVKLTKEHASRAVNVITKMGGVTRSEWRPDGSWSGEITLPAGMQQAFVDRLNDLTRGSVEINVVKKI
uniref:Ribosome assembly factor SBDS n=1 Tax=Candidatus Methanomethylicus mesodigestus TaxID=1867258 RepID=A0A7C3J419_9CREN